MEDIEGSESAQLGAESPGRKEKIEETGAWHADFDPDLV